MIINKCFPVLSGKLPPILKPMKKYLDKGIKRKIFKGESIEFTDNQSQNCYIIYVEKGMLKLCSNRPDGSLVNFSFFGASTAIYRQKESSYLSLCDKLSITACENTIAYCFKEEVFFEILRMDDELFNAFFEFHSVHLSMLMQRTSTTACLDADKRIAGWILNLCKGVPHGEENCFFVPCTMTQQEISDYLFIHVTTFNRVFARLKKENTVTKNRKGFNILDYQKLNEIFRDCNF